MEIEKAAGVARRGAYVRRSPELKAAIVAECLAPGASVAAVALAHGVNANLVRKWIEKSRPSTQAETDVSWLAVVTILAALALLDAQGYALAAHIAHLQRNDFAGPQPGPVGHRQGVSPTGTLGLSRNFDDIRYGG